MWADFSGPPWLFARPTPFSRRWISEFPSIPGSRSHSDPLDYSFLERRIERGGLARECSAKAEGNGAECFLDEIRLSYRQGDSLVEVEEKIRLLEEIKRLERSLHLMKSKLAAEQMEAVGQWPGGPSSDPLWEAQKKFSEI